MNELEIKKVPFMGSELLAVRNESGIWVGVSYICKGIGLGKNEKDRQVKNVQADKVLSRGCVKFGAGVFDPNNEAVAIKLDFLPLWLAKISITPTMELETPELAARLMEYQLKAKDVLAAAFMPDWQYGGVSKELQAIFMLDNRTVQHEQRITALEESMVVDYSQQRTLASQVSTVVIAALGGKNSPAYRDKNVRGRAYSECNRDIQDWFRVNSRNNIPRKRFDEAVEYIQKWKPSTNVSMIIRQTNQQMQLCS